MCFWSVLYLLFDTAGATTHNVTQQRDAQRTHVTGSDVVQLSRLFTAHITVDCRSLFDKYQAPSRDECSADSTKAGVLIDWSAQLKDQSLYVTGQLIL